MPRALRVCTVSGCTELTKHGKCDGCQAKANRARGKVTAHAYNSAWRSYAQAFLRRYPLCFVCGKQAHHVDHIDGQGPTGPRGFDDSNLQSLCRSHHSQKTVANDGGFGRYYRDGHGTDR